MSHGTHRWTLEGHILSKIAQSQRHKYFLFYYYEISQVDKNHRNRM